MGKIFGDNSLSIGNTPLVKLKRVAAGLPATILPDAGDRYHSSILFESISV